jgi:hypothetical protein
MHKLLTWKDAVAYCGLPADKGVKYLKRQVSLGTGPRSTRPSERKILFAVTDLDRWMATWRHGKGGA